MPTKAAAGAGTIRKQAKYWYQQAMVLGNQNAATFLNILVENEQNKIKTIQKQEDTKSQKEDDNHLRLKYDTEDEFLANEKNDGEAAFRIVQKCYNQLKTPATYAGENELYSTLPMGVGVAHSLLRPLRTT